MVPQPPPPPSLARWNDALQDKFGSGRNHEVDALRANHRDALTPKEARESDFIDVLWQRQYRCHHQDGIGADDDRHLQVLPVLLRFPIMTAASLHALPMHAGSFFVEPLESVQTQIPPLSAWVMRDDHAVGDETSCITGPAFQDRQHGEVGLFDDFLAACKPDP